MGGKKGKKVADPGWWPGYFIKGSMCTYFQYPVTELQDELRGIATRLLAERKGILAADESTGTMGKRLQDIGVENTEENRRQYRQLLCSADPAIGEFISGVVLHDETVYQQSDDGSSMIELLKVRGIVAGIKVDRGVVPIMGTDQECTIQGLDDLGIRVAQYKKDDCHFAKFRTVFKINRFTPSYGAIIENCNTLARFASIIQSQRMVPIMEIEIIPSGDHDLERAQKIYEMILANVVKAITDHNVYKEGIILKPSMVVPGTNCSKQYNPMDIARATVTTLLRTVPPAIPGIQFLSGGMSEEEAAVNLNAINKVDMKKPWRLSFNYGKALQTTVLKTWLGKPENVVNAQVELINRVRACGQASMGNYVAGMVTGVKSKDKEAKK